MKRKILASLACLLLYGCSFYRAHFPYNQECRAWIGEVNGDSYMGMTPDQAKRTIPDPQERYNYYMCVNSHMHPITQDPDIFFPDAEASAKIVGHSLDKQENTKDIFLTLRILYTMHMRGKYDVIADEQIMEAIIKSKSKIADDRSQKEFDELVQRMKANPPRP